MGVFDRWFGNGDKVRAARRAELRGDLAQAAELWVAAGKPEESARVMLLRGDAERDAQPRMQHYLQAIAVAPKGHPIEREVHVRRAQFVMSLGGGGAISAALRRDLMEAASELERFGEHGRAAEAYRLAGDEENQVRALTAAGEIEKLEALLASGHDRERRDRARREVAQEFEMLLSSGRRRDAVAKARRALRDDPDDHALRAELDAAVARRIKSPIVSILVARKRALVVLGSELFLGRSEGDIRVHSQAVSRKHLSILREGAETFVKDLGSKNGTTYRGMRLAGTIPVGRGLELKLGNEVPMRIEPTQLFPDCLSIDVLGDTYFVPLGKLRLPIGDWYLDRATDGWVELGFSEPTAYLAGAQVASPTTLFTGDAFSEAREAIFSLKVESKT